MPAQFILSLQTIVSRNISSLDAAVISVDAIESGSFGSVNVMPDKLRIGDTARSLTESVRNIIERRIKELTDVLANSFGCTAEVEYIRLGIPLVNHEEQTKRAVKAVEAVVGEAIVDRNREPSVTESIFSPLLIL